MNTKTIKEERHCRFCASQKNIKPPLKYPTRHEVRKTINSEATVCLVCGQQEYDGPRNGKQTHEVMQNGRKNM